MIRSINRISLSGLLPNVFRKSANNLLKYKTSQSIISVFPNSHSLSSLSTIHHYSYFTLVDKPLQSVALTSLIELGVQTITFPFIEWSCPAEASVILGGIAFRAIAELASKFVQEMKFANHQHRLLYKIVQKAFLVDLQRDLKFYELDHRKTYLLHKYFKASYLLKNLFTAYLSLNFFRACHFILQSRLFNSFQIHTLWVPTLASHDPSFTLPLLTIGFTYFWLAKSRHPFIIHLTRPQNFLYRINIAFMTGLLFVPLPTIYAFAYIGWMTGHLLIRTLTHERTDVREELRDLLGFNKQFIEKRQQRLMEQTKKEKDQKVESSLKENHKE